MRAPARTFVHARRLRRAMTLPEVLLWRDLRTNGVRARRQHPIGPYVLDFYVPSARLAIEVDGAAHDVPDVVRRDLVRESWLANRGVRVLRFNASDVLDPERRNGVLETILAALADV